jgi:hypothetical protein
MNVKNNKTKKLRIILIGCFVALFVMLNVFVMILLAVTNYVPFGKYHYFIFNTVLTSAAIILVVVKYWPEIKKES